MQNHTLEHYTSYKASELKATVLAMHELQLNLNGSSLNAIREKYRQPKVLIVSFDHEIIRTGRDQLFIF